MLVNFAKFRQIAIALAGSIFILGSPAGIANSSADTTLAPRDTEVIQNVTEVTQETNRQMEERRKKVLGDAVDALAQVDEALKALDEKDSDRAIESLAIATGKLELIVARDPDLALAATGVTVLKHDVLATKEAIKATISEAQKALEDEDVQRARYLLSDLRSEAVITVSHIPLATFPEAIKAITPLIDEGKIEQAKTDLQAALNTQVLINHVIPLPLVRAQALTAEAEILAARESRSSDENAQLLDYLAAAEEQLEMANILGYRNDDQLKDFKMQLAGIKSVTKDEGSKTGPLNKLKSMLGVSSD